MSWGNKTLGEGLSIKHGFAFKSEHFGDDPDYPVLVTPGNFANDGGFKQTKLKTYSGSVKHEYVLPPGATIVTMTDLSKTADSLGAAAIVPNDGRAYLHNQRIGLLQTCEPEMFDLRFIRYLTSTKEYRQYVVGTATGTTVRHTSPKRILEYSTIIPGIHEQRAIAEVLGALDDKIAANERVVGTAESLADALFLSAAADYSPGPITFQEVASIEGGGTPKTKVEDYWGDEVAWATPTDVTQLNGLFLGDTGRKLTEAGLSACSSRLHPAGSILMTSRATIGALAIAAIPMAVNQGFIVANAIESDGQWWLYHEMKSRVPEFLNFANGATFMELPRGKFKQIPVRWPSEEELRSFNVAVSEIHERGRAAGVESASLARTRDELLPLLMSGKISVKDAETVVSDAV